MARGVNKVILLGNLGKDPEMKYFPNGDAFCNLTLATSESWTDKQSGEKKEHTEWHNLVFRKKLAEIAGQYLKKGSKIYIEGSLHSRKWQDKEGKDRFTTEVVVKDMQMLDGKPGTGSMNEGGGSGGYAPRSSGAGSRQSAPASGGAPMPPADTNFEDDDIPF